MNRDILLCSVLLTDINFGKEVVFEALLYSSVFIATIRKSLLREKGVVSGATRGGMRTVASPRNIYVITGL